MITMTIHEHAELIKKVLHVIDSLVDSHNYIVMDS